MVVEIHSHTLGGWGIGNREKERASWKKWQLGWISEAGRLARQSRGDRVLQAKGTGCSEAQKYHQSEPEKIWAGPQGWARTPRWVRSSMGLGSLSVTLEAVGRWGGLWSREGIRPISRGKTFHDQKDGWGGGELGELLEKPQWEKDRVLAHTAVCKMDNQQAATVQHRELCSMLHGDPNGKEIQKKRG